MLKDAGADSAVYLAGEVMYQPVRWWITMHTGDAESKLLLAVTTSISGFLPTAGIWLLFIIIIYRSI